MQENCKKFIERGMKVKVYCVNENSMSIVAIDRIIIIMEQILCVININNETI